MATFNVVLFHQLVTGYEASACGEIGQKSEKQKKIGELADVPTSLVREGQRALLLYLNQIYIIIPMIAMPNTPKITPRQMAMIEPVSCMLATSWPPSGQPIAFQTR